MSRGCQPKVNIHMYIKNMGKGSQTYCVSVSVKNKIIHLSTRLKVRSYLIYLGLHIIRAQFIFVASVLCRLENTYCTVSWQKVYLTLLL